MFLSKSHTIKIQKDFVIKVLIFIRSILTLSSLGRFNLRWLQGIGPKSAVWRGWLPAQAWLPLLPQILLLFLHIGRKGTKYTGMHHPLSSAQNSSFSEVWWCVKFIRTSQLRTNCFKGSAVQHALLSAVQPVLLQISELSSYLAHSWGNNSMLF